MLLQGLAHTTNFSSSYTQVSWPLECNFSLLSVPNAQLKIFLEIVFLERYKIEKYVSILLLQTPPLYDSCTAHVSYQKLNESNRFRVVYSLFGNILNRKILRLCIRVLFLYLSSDLCYFTLLLKWLESLVCLQKLGESALQSRVNNAYCVSTHPTFSGYEIKEVDSKLC